MDKTSLQVGINLGGWISQYQVYDHAHFETFIRETDLQKIADWGFDHVRLPVDYPVLEADENPGVYKARGLGYIDNCLQWCQKLGLRLVLDLHRAPGYSFTNTLEGDADDANTLFTSPAMQARFMALWEVLTRRYLNQFEDQLAFELLNEMVLPDNSPWNALARKTIERIRGLDPTRLIVIGGNHYNAVTELQNIDVQADDNLLYTFHCYEPMTVTHQKAGWVPAMRAFNRSVDYPGSPTGLAEFLEQYPEHAPAFQGFVDRHIDKDYLQAVLQPAVDFSAQNGQPLYCGEFGVIDQAPMQTRINWTRDFIAVLRENNISYAYWTYKEMDFGLVNQKGETVDPDLVQAVIG